MQFRFWRLRFSHGGCLSTSPAPPSSNPAVFCRSLQRTVQAQNNIPESHAATSPTAAANYSIIPSPSELRSEHAAAAAVAAAAAAAANCKFEPGSATPAAIVSDNNGLQYANLDSSVGGGYGGGGAGATPTSAYQAHSSLAAIHHVSGCGSGSGGYTQYSGDIPQAEPGLTTSPAAPFSAYLDNPGQYPTTGHHYSLYHQPKIRTAHDYSASYPHVPKSSATIPTYKWMQVKRNVPKPGMVL